MNCPKTIISFVSVALLATNAFAEPVGSHLGNRGEGNLDPRTPTIRGSTPLLKRHTYPYPSYQECVDNIKPVAKDKSTFYSGLGYYANGQGYEYLKDFISAHGLLEVDSVYPNDFCTSDPDLNGGYGAYVSFAYSFSGLFAQDSSGTAYLLTPTECDPAPNSIWNKVERGNLTSSDNTDAIVTKIIRVDPATTTKSTTIFPTPTDSELPTTTACPTDPPLPSGGSATTTTSSNTTTASSDTTAVPQTNPECGPIRDVATSDAIDAQKWLAAKGNGASRDNCCAGGASECSSIALSGSAAVEFCAGATQQCAGCGDLAISLNVINVDCTKDYKVGGKVDIPYLEGATLELRLNSLS